MLREEFNLCHTSIHQIFTSELWTRKTFAKNSQELKKLQEGYLGPHLHYSSDLSLCDFHFSITDIENPLQETKFLDTIGKAK